MAKRFNIVGQSTTITDTVTGVVEYHLKNSDTWYDARALINNKVRLVDSSASNLTAGLFTADISDCVDGDNADTVFNASTFRSYMSVNFSTAGGGSSAWGDITGTITDQTDLNDYISYITPDNVSNNTKYGRGTAPNLDPTTFNNYFSGTRAGELWNLGSYNAVAGFGAGYLVTDAQEETYFGNFAGPQGDLGANTVVGSISAAGMTDITKCSIIGRLAGGSVVGGGESELMGYNSLFNVVELQNTIAVGTEVGNYANNGITKLYDCIIMGKRARPAGDGIDRSDNEIVIGPFTDGNGSNSVTIGNNNVTNTYLKGVLNIGTLPTSSAGLNVGDVWNDLGTLKVA